MSDLKGIISPFTTPFSENGEIDYSLVKPQVDWLIDNGVHGLAAGGSTGEGHVLDREEYIKLMKSVNPLVIPRNHRVEESLNEANKGNINLFNQLLKILKEPYVEQENITDYQIPSVSSKKYQTFCGT